MTVRNAILGLLADGPLHGYQIRAAWQRDLVRRGKLNIGQVYTTLDRLERDGLVAHERVSQAERPDKKVYAITGAGRAELEDWLGRPSASELDLRNETFLKIALAHRLRDGDPEAVIAVERRHAMAQLHELRQARVRADEETSALEGLLVDLAALRLEAFLAWLERCEETLGREDGP